MASISLVNGVKKTGLPLRLLPHLGTTATVSGSGLTFRETASGYFSEGASDFAKGYEEGRQGGTRMELDLHVRVDHLSEFITNPSHVASINGEVKCRALGGTLPITEGVYNLLVDDGDLRRKKVTYRITCGSGERQYTLTGTKELHDDAGSDALTDPATIYIEVSESAVPSGRGIVRAGAIDF